MAEYGLPANNALSAYLGVRDANNRQTALNANTAAQQVGILGMLQQQALRNQQMQQQQALEQAIATGDQATLMRTPGGIGILKHLAEIERAKKDGEYRDLQMKGLETKSALEGRQQQAAGALANLMTPSGSFGQGTEMERPNAQVFMNDAEAIAAMRAAEAAGQPFTANVPNPANVRALVTAAGNALPANTGREILRGLSPDAGKPAALSTVGKLMAERDALPPNDPRRATYDRIIAGTQSAGGINVNVNPNGPLIPGKTAQTDIDKGLLDTTAGMMRLSAIDAQFKPEYQQALPRVSAAWTGLKDTLGVNLPEQDKKFLTDFSSYKRNAINSLNEYIKSITGAAMSEAEAQRILRGMPNPGNSIFDGDSPTEFKAKLDDAMKQTKMSLARLEYMKRNGMSLTDGSGNFTVPLDRMPQLINQRASELEKQLNGNRAMVKQILAKEFGLIQ